MTDLRKAKFKVFGSGGGETSLDVQYNPNSLTFDKKPMLADIPIPGLDAPLKQFVRGQTETLSVELFFDTTENGMGAGATSVTTLTDPFYGLVKIDPETHAPPVCAFLWGSKFPGDSLPESYGNQRRTEFKGVVTGVSQEFSLFSPEGTPLRATLTVKLDEYRPLHEQINQLNLQSSDHHRVHILERDETLALVAHLHLDNPADWRYIADANGIDDPRRLDPGRLLTVPATR
jgi:Contractile injection system tube protein